MSFALKTTELFSNLITINIQISFNKKRIKLRLNKLKLFGINIKSKGNV